MRIQRRGAFRAQAGVRSQNSESAEFAAKASGSVEAQTSRLQSNSVGCGAIKPVRSTRCWRHASLRSCRRSEGPRPIRQVDGRSPPFEGAKRGGQQIADGSVRPATWVFVLLFSHHSCTHHRCARVSPVVRRNRKSHSDHRTWRTDVRLTESAEAEQRDGCAAGTATATNMSRCAERGGGRAIPRCSAESHGQPRAEMRLCTDWRCRAACGT